MLGDWSLAKDPRHQPMGAVLPVPIRIVSKPHGLHDDYPMLDAVIRLGPQDEVGQAGVAGFFVAPGSMLNAQVTERGQAGTMNLISPGQKSTGIRR